MTTSEWMLRHGDELQVVGFFGLLAILMAAERWAPRRSGPMDRKTRWPVNFFLTFVNLAAMSVLPISFISAAVWAEARGVGLLNWARVPVVVAVVATLLVRGFISFFTHYLNHMVPLFWRVHRIHHLDTELDVSTTVRFHPLEFVIGRVES
jgi:sterol desaturase/sphingolipid hydroxylase (fatty acid hydroxylase superfamily)